MLLATTLAPASLSTTAAVDTRTSIWFTYPVVSVLGEPRVLVSLMRG